MLDNYILWRTLIAVLFVIDLCVYAPYFSLTFGRRYHPTAWFNHPVILFIIFVSTCVASLFLLFGQHVILATAVLVVFTRYYFISTRFISLQRGVGAVGLVAYYAFVFVLLFEISFRLDPTLVLSRNIHMLLRVDLGVILLCSGLFKFFNGYMSGEGIEYACVNPIWSPWFRFLKKIPANSKFWLRQSQFECLSQIIMGVCLIIAPLQVVGAILCMVLFFGAGIVLRLARLPPLMMVLPVLFLPELSFLNMPSVPKYSIVIPNAEFYVALLNTAVVVYLVLLPVIKGLLYFNLYSDKPLPVWLQKSYRAYAKLVPIIVWRVFTADVCNFFIRIYTVDKQTGEEDAYADEHTVYALEDLSNIKRKFRYLQVSESIVQASMFNTLKYWPKGDNPGKRTFFSKLIKYAGTLGVNKNKLVKFEYVSIQKKGKEFLWVPVREFRVDLENKSVEEVEIDRDFCIKGNYFSSRVVREDDGREDYGRGLGNQFFGETKKRSEIDS